MIIISDTSPVANLLQINRLEILKILFKRIIVPPSVNKEICELENFGVNIDDYYDRECIEVIQPHDLKLLGELKQNLDEGEAEAIVLAKELNADYLLIDERLGSKIAKNKGLNTIGLLGVLIKAKEKGIISLVKPIINELEIDAGF